MAGRIGNCGSDSEDQEKQVNSAWKEHTRIVWRNPVRAYEGMEFKRKIQTGKGCDSAPTDCPSI